MTDLDTYARAHSQFSRTLGAVGDRDWDKPTPCGEWSVRGLASHVVTGERMAVVLLEGGSAEDARSTMGAAAVEGDLPEAFAAAAAAATAAFKAPGALERTVHHPIGDVTGSQLLGFRIGDATLHSWDLARALGIDETLEPELVESVWGQLEPISAIIGEIGVFGDGPSGTVSDDAELQLRLLDLTGRRP